MLKIFKKDSFRHKNTQSLTTETLVFRFSILFFSFLTTFTIPNTFAQKKIKTIVIDAGHGGKDPGTQKGSLKEKTIALNIALKLGAKIEEEMPDVKVIYTRKKDVFIPLNERAAIANRNKADLFICIHVNSNPYSSKLSGSETYVMGLHKTQDNLELAKRENEVILLEENYKKTYKGYDPNSPIAHIMMSNYQSAFMNESLKLASKVEKNIKKVGHKSRGVKQAGFLVLWQTSMPSLLIETGYITNPSDRQLLESKTGQGKIADAIFNAVKSYKEEVEK